MPRAGEDDVRAAVSAAASAMPGWAGTAPRERSEVLRRTFELMIERKEELAFLMSLEMGKSLTDARGEVVYAAEFFRWFAEEAVRVGGELRTAPSGANRILTFKQAGRVSRCCSRRGTSRPRWRRARSPRHWLRGARSCSSRPRTPR